VADGVAAAAAGDANMLTVRFEFASAPFVLSLRQAEARECCAYRSTNSSRRRGVEQFALRYLSANGDVEPIPAESDR
jgi:hypothetical protein